MAKESNGQVEYLVFCRGRPYNQGFGHKACRIDALARIVPAALVHGRTLHLLFEDFTLLCLTPLFLSEWQPGSLEGTIASEGRLLRKLDKVIGDNAQAGVKLQWGTQIQQCIEKVLTEDPKHPFKSVLMLSEVGCPLLLGREGNGLLNNEALSRMLIILGGVRDVTEEEDDAIKRACSGLQIPRHLVSLGVVSELTSKCIKYVEAAEKMGFLADALSHCEAEGWQVCDGSGKQRNRTPVHIIYELGESLDVFAQRPEAATLLVDVFRGSHHNYDNTLLSLLEPDGMSLMLQRSDFDCILKQKDALETLREYFYKRKKGTVADVLAREQQVSARKGMRFCVLHVDDRAAPLELVRGATCSGVVAAIAIVMPRPHASRAESDAAKALALSTGAEAVTVASVGGASGAMAFLCMLHNEGLLAPALQAPARTTTASSDTTGELSRPQGREKTASCEANDVKASPLNDADTASKDDHQASPQKDLEIASRELAEPSELDSCRAFPEGTLVLSEGRLGKIEWDGRPEHQYVKMKWEDNGQISEMISVKDIKVVHLASPQQDVEDPTCLPLTGQQRPLPSHAGECPPASQPQASRSRDDGVNEQESSRALPEGTCVRSEGRLGKIVWDGRPEHQYVKMKWEDDGQRSEMISVKDITVVHEAKVTVKSW